MSQRLADQPDPSREGEAKALEAETHQLLFSLLVHAGVNSDNIHKSNIPLAKAFVSSENRHMHASPALNLNNQ